MKLDHIDSIRGIAILMVILIHSAQSVPELDFPVSQLAEYGQMGVQLFFVASAYTLCLSYERRDNEKYKILNFFTRRFLRIAPSYYIIGILGYFFVKVIQEYSQQGTLRISEEYSAINVLANIIFVHGLHPPSNNSIVPGGWSIGTEMVFYALFPIIMKFSFFFHKVWKESVFFFPVVTLLVSLTIQSMFYLSTGYIVDINNFIYFNIINQLPVFMIGITVYFLDKDKLKLITSPKINLLGFGFFTLLSLLTWDSQALYKFALVPALSGTSFVFLIYIFKTLPQLNFLLLKRVGTLSYSIYLVHFIFASYIARPLNSTVLSKVMGSNLSLITTFLISLVGSFGVALVTEKLIEKPFIEYGRNLIYQREHRSISNT